MHWFSYEMQFWTFDLKALELDPEAVTLETGQRTYKDS